MRRKDSKQTKPATVNWKSAPARLFQRRFAEVMEQPQRLCTGWKRARQRTKQKTSCPEQLIERIQRFRTAFPGQPGCWRIMLRRTAKCTSDYAIVRMDEEDLDGDGDGERWHLGRNTWNCRLAKDAHFVSVWRRRKLIKFICRILPPAGVCGSTRHSAH